MTATSSSKAFTEFYRMIFKELPRHAGGMLFVGLCAGYVYLPELSLLWLSVWWLTIAGLSAYLMAAARQWMKQSPSEVSYQYIERQLALIFFLQGVVFTLPPLWVGNPELVTLLMINVLVMLSGVMLFVRFRLFIAFVIPFASVYIRATTGTADSLIVAVLAIVYLITIAAVYRASQLSSRLIMDRELVHYLNHKLEERDVLKTRDLESSQLRLQMAISASDMGIWDWNVQSRETYLTEGSRLVPPRDVTGEYDYVDWVHPEDYQKAKAELFRHLKGKTTSYRVRYRVKNNSGQGWIWVEDTGRAVERDRHGRVTRMIGTRREVTSEVNHEQDLSLAASLFNHSDDAIFVMSYDFIVQSVNPAYCRIMNANRAELVNKPFTSISASPQAYLVMSSLNHKGYWQGEILEKRYNGESFPFKCRIDGIFDSNGQLSHYIAIGTDMTEMRRSQVEIDYLSNYDKLTGLANRSHFHQVLNRHLQNPQAASDSLAIVVVNLDRFQAINDSLGYETGDLLLKDIASRITNLPSPSAFCARVGGDEFVVIAEFFGSRDKLNRLLDNILVEISRPVLADEHELIVTASIGVSILDGQNRHQLLNQASIALNRARHKGGNTYEYYQKTFKQTSVDRLQLEKSLRRAIAENELSVNYQPKLNLMTGRIDSVEALVRWHHQSLGLIEPEHFIPIAEEIGLINAMGEQVLYKACDEASVWQQRGFGNIRVSVNLSSHQLRQEGLYDSIYNILQTSELPAEYLELELTESVLIENMDHSVNTLNRLHALGTKIALDDFGTGYSSLSYLQKLPIDVLKIDKSFLHSQASGAGDTAIIKAIIAMANSMSMEVVAEGVENNEQLQFLKDQGCHYAQGYLVSQPLPASEILNLLRHYNYQPASTIERVH
ncbi:bifunctional diguanylate cyclase/phosphodiesterase [Gynuella sunshinyii]|nr:EAL domain-containing protein [Gynuella sunshinyii]